MSDMIITKHFMERFFERVLDKECTYCRYDVLNIIQEMMHHYESKAFNTFKSSTEKVKLPFGKQYHAVVQNNTLITCYKVD
jgi:hypothetical protein